MAGQPMHATAKSALKAAGCSDADCQQLEAAVQAGALDWSKLADLLKLLPQLLPIILALFGAAPMASPLPVCPSPVAYGAKKP